MVVATGVGAWLIMRQPPPEEENLEGYHQRSQERLALMHQLARQVESSLSSDSGTDRALTVMEGRMADLVTEQRADLPSDPGLQELHGMRIRCMELELMLARLHRETEHQREKAEPRIRAELAALRQQSEARGV